MFSMNLRISRTGKTTQSDSMRIFEDGNHVINDRFGYFGISMLPWHTSYKASDRRPVHQSFYLWKSQRLAKATRRLCLHSRPRRPELIQRSYEDIS
ncbi:hypothetical protein KP509_05G010900 [Ceratopteris richardii]|uniref:Uncharacterized protein n=1 Tax=Ceratopteris richardii TaxID=49495 RepID=A0A8T2UQV7_CERRI|nr:hypothetical protein KP509_05G010900 [Ceratopteris richardii]